MLCSPWELGPLVSQGSGEAQNPSWLPDSGLGGADAAPRVLPGLGDAAGPGFWIWLKQTDRSEWCRDELVRQRHHRLLLPQFNTQQLPLHVPTESAELPSQSGLQGF